MCLPRYIPLFLSWRLRVGVLLLHSLAVFALLLVNRELAGTELSLFGWLLWPGLLLSLWRAWPRRLSAGLLLRRDGWLEWREGAGEGEAEARVILPTTVVTPFWVVLHDHPVSELGLARVQVRRTLLLPDSMPAGDFRILRVWLSARALTMRFKALKALRQGLAGEGGAPQAED